MGSRAVCIRIVGKPSTAGTDLFLVSGFLFLVDSEHRMKAGLRYGYQTRGTLALRDRFPAANNQKPETSRSEANSPSLVNASGSVDDRAMRMYVSPLIHLGVDTWLQFG